MLHHLVTRLALLPVALQIVVLTTAQGTTDSDSESEITPTRSSQSSSTAATRTSTNTGPATHTVKVGAKEDPHQYIPHTIKADVGDVIEFEFYPRNHSVVQADYLAPCVPATGRYFYSGIFNSFDEEDGMLVGKPPTWKLTVNDTKPTFFYCTAIDSCIVNGMVGVINPNESMTWDAQYAKALKYPYMLVPGQAPPAEGSDRSEPSSSPSSSSSGLGRGAIAGIVIGSIAAISILAALFFVLGRNRVYRKWLNSEEESNDRTRRWAMSGGDWSMAGRSEKDGVTMGSHPAHTSMMSPDMSHVGGPYSPPLQSRSPPPAHRSWDGLGQYHTPIMQDERPPELSSAAGVQLVELEATPQRHPSKGRHQIY
ncbi:extracellular serine-rich protein [Coccidioides immitis RS]|uniref:Extracellular serine-rich protein n=4 Tax=Coccidioides immitis TaxID=5501 RepID=J3KEU7_COCIM|nr:extracellular serine-rich protein [Coccidioides immitis RS]KMP05272.1 hypothetical protein CIRG_04953 [Coccidioides immitis RMSCC 2394]KMU77803.1 hypothetical protein CISG_01559 [Coccidioides immitis RMSCC 3703]KMU85732.1 hypothetical protein CIHG_03772 [Coccidioides immitis H538.4]TPX21643.1 hypothetical protein DIZ76_015602 [Coccidioides immitis]EAS34054.3 extracellular serine-rich protein [Coccidioides immitis RS]